MSEHELRLTTHTREMLAAPDAARIRYMKHMRWIDYERATEVLEVLEDLFDHPPKDRMPCLLLIGETNNGKTELIKRFLRKHPGEENVDGEAIIKPIVYVESPPVPSEDALYDEILNPLHLRRPKLEGRNAKRDRCVGVLKEVGAKMLILDEIHSVLQGTANQQNAFLFALKYLANKLKIPIVGVGVETADLVISSDAELENRFQSETMMPWIFDEQLGDFLSAYETILPLRKASGLYEAAKAKYILEKAENKVGEISDLLTQAASWAIKTGVERISFKIIDECGYEGPTVRRQIARSELGKSGVRRKR